MQNHIRSIEWYDTKNLFWRMLFSKQDQSIFINSSDEWLSFESHVGRWALKSILLMRIFIFWCTSNEIYQLGCFFISFNVSHNFVLVDWNHYFLRETCLARLCRITYCSKSNHLFVQVLYCVIVMTLYSIRIFDFNLILEIFWLGNFKLQ